MGALSKEEGAGPNASKIVLTSAFLQYVALLNCVFAAACSVFAPLSPQLLLPQLLLPQL